jgi:hypothetical protein
MPVAAVVTVREQRAGLGRPCVTTRGGGANRDRSVPRVGLNGALPVRTVVAVGVDRKLLDTVMTELVAVSRSATSKREEALNLALIWNGRYPGGRHRRPEAADQDQAASA